MTNWTKLQDGTWGIRGTGIVTGMPVTITKRNGEKVRRIAGEVLWTNGTESIARVEDPKLTLAELAVQLEEIGFEVVLGRKYIAICAGDAACYTADEANQFLAFYLAAERRIGGRAMGFVQQEMPGRHFTEIPCTREQDALLDGGLERLLHERN